MRRIGIDLALRSQHRAVVYEDDRKVGKSFGVPHSKEGLADLIARGAGEGGGQCEFIMEPTGLMWLPIAAEVIRNGHKAYVPKPQKTRDLRRVLSRHTKTDGRDAEAAALLRHLDSSGVHELQVPNAHETTLRLFVAQRSRLVLEASRTKNRVQAWLLLAVPGLVSAMGDPFSGPATAFLRQHLDPFKVRDKGLGWLRTFWRRNADGGGTGSRADAVWKACGEAHDLYEGLRQADRLPFDYTAIQQLVRLELEHLEALSDQVSDLERTISSAYSQLDPERVLEREVPGVGPTIAPAIEAYVGNVRRFANVKQFAAYFGLVPRTSQTGGKTPKPGQRLTRGGPNLLKQYMFLAAESARRADPELAATYAGTIAKGKHHYAAVIVVAHKLIRRVYALMRLRESARDARTAGKEAPAVTYSLKVPGTAERLSAAEARAWVSVNFPSKAAIKRQQAQEQAVADAPPKDGDVAPSSPEVPSSEPAAARDDEDRTPSSVATSGRRSEATAAPTRLGTGSPKGATRAGVGQPPREPVARSVGCGKTMGQPVEMMLET